MPFLYKYALFAVQQVKLSQILRGSEADCELCQLVVESLYDLIGPNATDAKINITVYQICADIPGQLGFLVRSTLQHSV